MKCIILVGGYATRMGQLTKNKAKSLLEIECDTVLDIIINNIEHSTKMIDEYILVTNETFYTDFIEWRDNNHSITKKITIISDGSKSDAEKVGAGTALINVLEYLKTKDDVFVIAGDNIINFSLDYIFDAFKTGSTSFIMYYIEPDIDRLTRTGVIEINEDGYIISMEEKPKYPKSNYAVPPFYWLKNSDIKLLLNIFKKQVKIDSMGKIILELCKYSKINTKIMLGERYDIGFINDYEYVKNKQKIK